MKKKRYYILYMYMCICLSLIPSLHLPTSAPFFLSTVSRCVVDTIKGPNLASNFPSPLAGGQNFSCLFISVLIHLTASYSIYLFSLLSFCFELLRLSYSRFTSPLTLPSSGCSASDACFCSCCSFSSSSVSILSSSFLETPLE